MDNSIHKDMRIVSHFQTASITVSHLQSPIVRLFQTVKRNNSLNWIVITVEMIIIEIVLDTKTSERWNFLLSPDSNFTQIQDWYLCDPVQSPIIFQTYISKTLHFHFLFCLFFQINFSFFIFNKHLIFSWEMKSFLSISSDQEEMELCFLSLFSKTIIETLKEEVIFFSLQKKF